VGQRLEEVDRVDRRLGILGCAYEIVPGGRILDLLGDDVRSAPLQPLSDSTGHRRLPSCRRGTCCLYNTATGGRRRYRRGPQIWTTSTTSGISSRRRLSIPIFRVAVEEGHEEHEPFMCT